MRGLGEGLWSRLEAAELSFDDHLVPPARVRVGLGVAADMVDEAKERFFDDGDQDTGLGRVFYVRRDG